MTAKIKARKEIAKNMLYVELDLLGQDVPFIAGQFFSLTLINPLYTDNRSNSRFLGIVNSPSEKSIFSVLTRTGVSAFKKSLAEIPIGTEVEIGGIDGHIHLPEDKSQPVVFIAVGVGIAPFMSIIRWCNENSWPHTLTLLYINEDRASAAFLEELEGYAKDNQQLKLITIMTQDSEGQGEKRQVDAQLIKDYFPNPEKNIYFITGAPQVAPNVFRSLIQAGVPAKQLTMEIFTGY